MAKSARRCSGRCGRSTPGGIWGRTLIAEEAGIDPRLDLTQQQQRAAQLASDDSYVAVIGPGTSDLLAATADLFVEHKSRWCRSTRRRRTSCERTAAKGGSGAPASPTSARPS